MGILDNILLTAKNATDVATKKTNEVLDSSKLKIKCIRLSNEIKGKYEKLGLTIYNIMETGVQDDEVLLDIADEIDSLLIELKATNALLNEKQKEKVCARCGTKNSNITNQCNLCGFDLNCDDFDFGLEDEDFYSYDSSDECCCDDDCKCDGNCDCDEDSCNCNEKSVDLDINFNTNDDEDNK